MQTDRPSLDAAPQGEERRQAVLTELARVLTSDGFRGSKRCQEFLRYIVEHSVDGTGELLKERNIGIEVFHRSPSYEPNTDAIVRVRASEVRKRLAQYYDHLAEPAEVRIVLAPGTYVPEFHWRSDEVRPPEPSPVPAAAVPAPPAIPRRLSYGWLMVIPLALVLAAGGWLATRSPSSLLYDFWRPLVASRNPVMICLGQPVVYHLSRRLHDQYLKTQPANRMPGPYIIPLHPGDIDASDVLPVPDQYVGAGSAHAAARLSATLARWNKPTRMRIGNDVSFSDLKDYPAVLEGAFSNDWTIRLTQKMPFIFVQEGGVRGIREQVAPYRIWQLKNLQADGKTAEDYAVVARVFDSGTLEPLVEAAGVTQYGTQAAGEFIANEDLFAEAMGKAPADWRTRNLQILLHVNVIGRIPGRPEVIAIRTW